MYGRTFTLTDPSSTAIGAPARGPGKAGRFTREPGFLSYQEVCSGFVLLLPLGSIRVNRRRFRGPIRNNFGRPGFPSRLIPKVCRIRHETQLGAIGRIGL